MGARLVFKNDKNEFVTKDVDVDPSLKGTEGGYSVRDGKTPMSLFDFDLVGIQWLRDKPKGTTVKIPGRPDMFIPDDAQKITAQTMYADGKPTEVAITISVNLNEDINIDSINNAIQREIRYARQRTTIR